jgi:hypothetical protein
MLQMSVPPVQIHVMSAIRGVEWPDAWSDRVAGRIGSHNVQFLGRETFLRNKRAAGRPKDLAVCGRLVGCQAVNREHSWRDG